MQPLTIHRLAGNAFRTLGLSASAGQAAINAAARRMRIWPDPVRIPSTPWDLPWLGPLPRTRGDVERAVARLNEPATRLQERLLWYHASSPPFRPAESPERGQDRPDADSVTGRHEAALMALHSVSISDPDAVDAERWRQAMALWTVLASSPEYAAWLARVEAEGDFEKRVAVGEIEAAARDVNDALAESFVSKARAALDRGDTAGCARIAAIVQSAGAGSAISRRLLDVLEDALEARLVEMDASLSDKLRSLESDRAKFYRANWGITHQWDVTYRKQIAPAVTQFCQLAADDPDRAGRVRTRAARALVLLAIGWEWSGELASAERILTEAMTLAQDGPAEEEVRVALERIRPLAEAERAAQVAEWKRRGLIRLAGEAHRAKSALERNAAEQRRQQQESQAADVDPPPDSFSSAQAAAEEPATAEVTTEEWTSTGAATEATTVAAVASVDPPSLPVALPYRSPRRFGWKFQVATTIAALIAILACCGLFVGIVKEGRDREAEVRLQRDYDLAQRRSRRPASRPASPGLQELLSGERPDQPPSAATIAPPRPPPPLPTARPRGEADALGESNREP